MGQKRSKKPGGILAVIFSKQKTFSDLKALVPRFLPRTAMNYESFDRNKTSDEFNLQNKNFASLANWHELTTLMPHLCEIDITDELHLMTEDSNLEIAVPMMGVVDLFRSPQFSHCAQQFAMPLAINGFGAKSKDKENSFPKADFVLVTDIVGNQYELIVNADGSLEMPREGTGLFSLITAITFIFNAKQVKTGWGLENYQSKGLKANTLYLLPPVETNERCIVRICVSHVQPNGKRIVDSIRPVELNSLPISLGEVQADVVVSKGDARMPEMLFLNLGLIFTKSIDKQLPFSLSVSLDKPNQLEYGFNHPKLLDMSCDNHGWLQHPHLSNVFTKHFGLQVETKEALIRTLYNQYDLMKDYLQGDQLGMITKQGYNNFLLLPEGFGIFYDLLVHDVAHHKVSGDFLLDRIDDMNLSGLSLSDIPVDFHDSVVLAQVEKDIHNHDLSSLKQLFASSDENYNLTDHFNFFSSMPLQTTPNAHIEMTANPYHDELALPMTRSETSEGLHMHEVLTTTTLMNHAFDITHHHVDLDALLDKQHAWTPSLDAPMTSDVNVVVHDLGETFQTHTSVNIQPSLEIEIDPSHIHTHF